MGNGQPGGEAQPQTHNETIRKTVASYSYQRSVMEVHQEFSQLDPAAISDACRAWKRAADELTALADDLKSQAADKLHAAWSAPSSPDAQKQLQYSEATARALANDCLQMAHSTDYAAQYATWYKDNLPSYTDSLGTAAKGLVQGDGLTAGADAATQHLVNFLSRYNEVISTLPSSVQDILVPSKPYSDLDTGVTPPGGPSGIPGTYTGHGGGGPTPPKATTGPDKPLKPITDPFRGPDGNGPGGTGPGGTGTGSTGVGTGGSGTGTSGLGSGIGGSGTGTSGLGSGVGAGVGASDPYAAGSSLAGTGLGGGLSSFDPSALGSGASGVAGGGGLGSGLSSGLGAAGLGAGGLGAGVGASRAGSGLGGRLAGLGSGGLGSGASGTPGAIGAGGLGSGGIGSRAGGGLQAERAGSYGRGGAGALAGEGGAMGGTGRGTGGNMMPMHGAGHGGEGEEERQRSTWLTEDDDLWGAGGDVPPPVITS